MVSDSRCPTCYGAVHPCSYNMHVTDCMGPETLDDRANMIAGELYDLMCSNALSPRRGGDGLLDVELYEALHRVLSIEARPILVRHMKDAVRSALKDVDRSGCVDVDDL